MSKRILFVDDEPLVLQGIERSLRSMRAEWQFEFANGGPAALELMSRSAFDVVITDMRMPGMDGAQLLEQVKAKFPRTVRMVLSGQSDRETILRSVGPTHQYLSKPCDVQELKHKLTRAFALRELLDDPRVKELVGRLQTVPSLPSLYIAVTEALRSPEASITEVGNIIAQDMGMSMKVLQLVNSAFFGLPCQVSNPRQAAALIGIDNIKALVLSLHVFSEFETDLEQGGTQLWKHSFATAGFAKAIARTQNAARNLTDDAFAAGLLHDVGRLILASASGPEYKKALQQTTEQKIALSAVEHEFFGCTHGRVGAYLLGLWGLPYAIVESVAWHHDPAHAAPQAFSPLLAVHAADYFDHQIHSYSYFNEAPGLDEVLLSQLGLSERVPVWLQACQELDSKGENHV
jgi:HD-like signal output (HDOD) protein/ActR/RegA family two-component response regulator